MRLLAEKVVELEIAAKVSHETVRQTLKNRINNRTILYWVIPPECDAEFVANMEEVLETYEKPYDPTHPVICMDEQPVHASTMLRFRLRAESNRNNSHHHALERSELPAAGGVPQDGGFVTRTLEDVPAVGAEGYGTTLVRVKRCPDALPGICFDFQHSLQRIHINVPDMHDA
ncbi:hypothetical protein [Posidoniimonas polymericola]